MTVPVPLTDIEARKDGPPGSESWQMVYLSLSERAALCEALRIAVEAMEQTCDGTVLGAISRNALAAVRELVDLGEKP